MDCNRIRERLDEFILGGLELPGRAMVAMHVANCYECREELHELEVLLNELVPQLRHPLPVDRFGELLVAIDEDRRKARASAVDLAWRRRITHRALAAAAAIVLFLIAGPWVSHMVSEPFDDPAERAEAAVQSASDTDLKDLFERRALLERRLMEEPQTAPFDTPKEKPSTALPQLFGWLMPETTMIGFA
jgi:hypothetical protein